MTPEQDRLFREILADEYQRIGDKYWADRIRTKNVNDKAFGLPLQACLEAMRRAYDVGVTATFKI